MEYVEMQKIRKEFDCPEKTPVKKRLLLIVRWPIGGIRTFMRYVYRGFEPHQYHLTIIGPNNPELDVLERDLEGLDFEIIRVSDHPSHLELFAAATKQLLFGKYNIVHSHGFTSGICSALPAYFLRTPHILTPHDMLNQNQFTGMTGYLKKYGIKIALSLVNKIHLISYDAHANLLQFFPNVSEKSGKCVVIPNGIESKRFLSATPVNLHEELGISEDIFLIGFLGRFMAPKGFIYLVDAVEQLVNTNNIPKNLMVLTFGEGAFIREEMVSITKRKLDSFFKFLPFTSNVAGVIKGLDIVVIPSIWETCPLLPMEVLTCGIPLLATDCIGLREVVKNTITHIVPSKNANALAEGIKLFMQKDMRLKFKEFAPLAAQRYDVRSTVTALQDLISDMVNS